MQLHSYSYDLLLEDTAPEQLGKLEKHHRRGGEVFPRLNTAKDWNLTTARGKNTLVQESSRGKNVTFLKITKPI